MNIRTYKIKIPTIKNFTVLGVMSNFIREDKRCFFMRIREFMKDYDNKYFRMKDKLLELKEAERRFRELSGVKISEFPKDTNNNKTFDFVNQLANIERIAKQYEKLEKEYLIVKNRVLKKINEIDKPIYRTIIILAFLEKKRDKEISSYLNKIYKVYYTEGYIRQLKSKAIRMFEKVIKED